MSSAPALERGLDVIQHLTGADACSLEELARALSAPKSTLLRVCAVLIERGVLRRGADKRYSLRLRLRPVAEPRARRFPEAVRQELDRLGEQLQATVEWYDIDRDRDNGCSARITARYEPDHGPVRVRARLGFRRPATGEVEAVATVLLTRTACRPGSDAWWYRDGAAVACEAAALRRHLAAHAGAAVVVDHAYNSNGIRRMAAPVCTGDGALAGILALAECYTPAAERDRPARCAALRHSAAALTDFLATTTD